MNVPPAALPNLLHHLATASANAFLYAAGHPQVARHCAHALTEAEGLLADREEISLVLIGNQLIFEGRPLEQSPTLERFAQGLRARGIGHLKVRRGVTRQEVIGLVRTLSRHGGENSFSTDHVRLGKVEVRFSRGESETAARREISGLGDIHADERAKLMEIYEVSRRRSKLKVVGIFEIVSSFVDVVREIADPLLALGPLRSKDDDYTFTHSTNVCILTVAQAMTLGVEESLLQDIGVAALLHDIGKLFIPAEVLEKPGRLDDAEWEIIRRHPLLGARYLLENPGVPRIAVIAAYEHHMQFDFRGYPSVGGDWQQNLCSQMTAVSDVFDALRTKRPYRGAMEMGKIAGILSEGAGSQLNPVLSRHFLRLLDRLNAPGGSAASD